MKTKIFLITCIVLTGYSAFSQVKIGINPTSINSASLLELESTNQGFVLPRVYIGSVTSSAPLASALLKSTLVYNTNSGITGGTGVGIYMWDSTKWNPITTSISSTAWLLDGNAVTAVRKFGNTTNFDLPFITNNLERMRLTAGGFLGIGTTNPLNVLSVSGTNPLYLAGLQATTTLSTDSILIINAGVVKKAAYAALTGSTTNTLTLSNNTLTSTVNGVAATSGTVSGVGNTSSANIISTTVNGVTGATVPIINTNTNALTQAGGLVTSVNGVAATTTISGGTVSNVIGYDASGTPVYQSLNNINFSTAWNTTGNSGTTAGTNYIGTTDNVDFVTKTNGIERMRVLANGRVGIGITNPAYPLAVKDTMEIRRAGSLSTLLFTNTAGSGDFRIAGDGGDFFWQGGGGRALQMGSYWTTILGGDRQTTTYPSFINSLSGTSVLVQGQRDVSVPLGIQANSSTQSANLTEWRNSSATALSVINKNGYMGIGITSPPNALSVLAVSNPLYLSGVQATSTFNTDSILTINAGIVKKAPFSSLNSTSWSTTGNSATSYPTNFLGTTDNNSLHIRTNNIERMVIDSVGSVGIGSANFSTTDREKLLVDYGATTSNYLTTFRGSINDFLQLNIQNTNSGSNASSDYVATANDGTDSTYYVDFGINSSTYAPSIDNFGGPHDGYMYSASRNLLIGTASTNSDVIFLLGGGRTKINAALRLQAATGNVVVGTGDGSTTPIGNVIRGVSGTGTNIAGGNLGVQGGAATGSAAGGNLNLAGGNSVSGSGGSITLSTGSTERMRVSALGNVGIGTTNPGYPLSVLSAANPLYLSGVQATSTFSTDSILTINAGVVKKAASSALIANWNLTGNTGTAASSNRIGYAANNNFLGTTDATNFTIATNNINRAIFDQAGNLYGGGTGTNISSAANGSFAWGDSNIVYGSDALVAGYYNIDSSKNSFVFGNNNVLGAGGARTNRGTLVGGGSNVVTGGQSYNSIITGSQNILSGDNFESLVLGYNNTVTNSQKVIVSGQQSAVSGCSFATISGGFNIMTNVPFGTILGGGNNIGSGAAYGVTIGQNNTIPANQSNAMALGAGVTTTASGQFAANFSGGYNLFTTGGATTSATPDLAITSAGNVGIGISNPPNVLSVLAASNPLYLSGVQATSTFSSDSILTINAGVVKKTPYSSLPGGGAWALTGNSSTTAGTNFLGTTDANALVFKVNNTQAGYIGIGSLPATALGLSSSSTGTGSTAIGASAQATANAATAIGYLSVASNQDAIAIGDNAQAKTNNEATAIGHNSTTTGYQAVAMGTGSSSTNNQAIAIGVSSSASGYQGIAIGNSAAATTNNSALAVGVSAGATGYQSTAIGSSASATAQNSTAIGNGATTSQANALVLGNSITNVGIGTSTPNTSTKLDVAGSYKLGTAGTVLTSMIKTTGTSAAVSISVGNTSSATMAVSGANINANIIINPRSALPNGVVIAYSYVSAANTVTIVFTSGNFSGTLAATTFDVTVIQ